MHALKTQQKGIKWRPYQAEALDAVDRCLGEDGCNPLVVIPTGGGKGPLSGEIARRYIARTGKRVIIATHVKELVAQNYQQARRVAPQLSAGIFSASLGRKDRHGQVTVANIQSIAGQASFFTSVGLLVIDEAHLLKHEEDGQYHETITKLRRNYGGLHVVGLTATPWRTNSGNLVEPYKGVEPLFNDVAYEIGIGELVSDGYLTRLVHRNTRTHQHIENVHIKMGEYNARELNAAVNTDPLNEAITDEVLQTAAGRQHILDFCVGVDHAQRVCATYLRRGVNAAYVISDQKIMSAQQRDATIAAFKAGRLRVLINCGILTTGFDYAWVDCLVHRRPTASPGLYLQICGRGTRVVYADGYDLDTREGRLDAIAAGGKPDCLMLDFAGNTKRHGLVDQVKGVFKKGSKPDVNLVECPACNAWNVDTDDVCVDCGEALPKKGGGGSATAADKEAKLSDRNLIDGAMGDTEEFQVLGMRYGLHQKPGKPDMLKLSFTVPGEPWPVTQYLCFNHVGWQSTQARERWRKFSPETTPPPKSVEEALSRADELRQPTRIFVRRRGSFFDVVGTRF